MRDNYGPVAEATDGIEQDRGCFCYSRGVQCEILQGLQDSRDLELSRHSPATAGLAETRVGEQSRWSRVVDSHICRRMSW
jgi:hypothetical protein